MARDRADTTTENTMRLHSKPLADHAADECTWCGKKIDAITEAGRALAMSLAHPNARAEKAKWLRSTPCVACFTEQKAGIVFVEVDSDKNRTGRWVSMPEGIAAALLPLAYASGDVAKFMDDRGGLVPKIVFDLIALPVGVRLQKAMDEMDAKSAQGGAQ